MRYKCEPGFTVVGRKSILCQADGTWTRSELPTCIPVQCKVMISVVTKKSVVKIDQILKMCQILNYKRLCLCVSE